MEYAVFILFGTPFMSLVDRAMWRHMFLILSVSNNIGDWRSIELKSNYRWLEPIKWFFYFTIPSIVFYIVKIEQNLFNVSILTILMIIYIVYIFQIASKKFEELIK